MHDVFLALKAIHKNYYFIFWSRYAEAKCKNNDYNVQFYIKFLI